jgi:hypothetical protein
LEHAAGGIALVSYSHISFGCNQRSTNVNVTTTGGEVKGRPVAKRNKKSSANVVGTANRKPAMYFNN